MAHRITDVPHLRFEVQIGQRGRLVLPAPFRRRLGLRPGDRLVLILDPRGETRLVSLRQQVQACCGMLARIAPERVLSEELVAERRQEAQSEEAP